MRVIWSENREQWFLAPRCGRNQYHNLCQTSSIRNLGLEHFYAAFGLGCSRNLRTSSARAFGISENNISEDCSVPSGIAKRLRPLTHGTPCQHPQPQQCWMIASQKSRARAILTAFLHHILHRLYLYFLAGQFWLFSGHEFRTVIWKVLKSTVTLTFVSTQLLWGETFLHIMNAQES